jgi:hypothetical protein
MDRDAWNSHKWSSARGRQIEIEPASRSFNIVVPDAGLISWKMPRPANDTPCTFLYSALGDCPILLADCPGAPLPFNVEVRSKLIEKRVK